MNEEILAKQSHILKINAKDDVTFRMQLDNIFLVINSYLKQNQKKNKNWTEIIKII